MIAVEDCRLDVRNISSKELLRKFKELIQDPPSVLWASAEVLSDHYGALYEIEEELNRRLDQITD